MSDLTARAIADLKAELSEFRANANKVSESMGSEILRLQGELESARRRTAIDFEAMTGLSRQVDEQRDRAHRAEAELEAARAEALRVGKDFCATAAELSTTRAELDQQRTRAEAAEQQAREECLHADEMLLVVKHCHVSSTHAATMRGLNPAVGALLYDAGKLAAIRAHLAGVDWQDLNRFVATKGPALAPTRRDTLALIAAAREALEP